MVQPRVARQSHDILDPLSLQDVLPVVASEATIDTDPVGLVGSSGESGQKRIVGWLKPNATVGVAKRR
jgi:hypothetical protein